MERLPMPLLSIPPPPIHAEDPGSPPPEFILLDPYGYLSARANATTAGAFTTAGHRILVTFWAAAPPRASCFTVHCPDLKPAAFVDMPKILTTEDDLALLRTEPPSLRPIPDADDYYVCDAAVLLRCRAGDMYFLAVLRPREINEEHCNLHLYSSKTGRWSTKLMHVDAPPNFEYVYANRVITVGGEFGSVGWADLKRGILICDVLLDNHILRGIPLPLPLVTKQLRGYPMFLRNIIVLKGYIKIFAMERPSSSTGYTCITEGWDADTWKTNCSDFGSWKNSWEEDCTIKFSEVTVSNPADALMLPDLQEGDDTEPTLMRLSGGYPVLSLRDDDVVYIMHRPNPVEDKASVRASPMIEVHSDS
ncbi:hypothetical protein ACP70R_007226 [Stipagrostis hirtigluma subsp. patula]